MKRLYKFLALLLCINPLTQTLIAQISGEKQFVIESIDNHAAQLISISDQIWKFAETALREHQSAKVLADFAESNGMKVQRGVAICLPLS